MCHRIIVALVLFGTLGAGADLQAEVRSITDREGNYVETRFLFNGFENVGSMVGRTIWSPVRGYSGRGSTLNPRGDAAGDLWPAIVDTGQGPHYAWAVWSRRDGMDYELVWSRWTDGGWRSTHWVYPMMTYAGADLDAHLTVDVTGRPYLTWWRDENGQGRVYMSLFAVTQWMTAYPVSEPGVDGRYPNIQLQSDGNVLVTYETPGGVVEHSVLFDGTVTITDDIDPLDWITDGGRVYVDADNP